MLDVNTYQTIRDAIVNRSQVTLWYQRHYREVCPHVLGLKNGHEHVLMYQFGGTSSSGLPVGGQWRCMDVDQITNATTRDGEWHTGTNHSQPQTCVDEIDVEVDY